MDEGRFFLGGSEGFVCVVCDVPARLGFLHAAEAVGEHAGGYAEFGFGIVSPEAFDFMELYFAIVQDDSEVWSVATVFSELEGVGFKVEVADVSVLFVVLQQRGIVGFRFIHRAFLLVGFCAGDCHKREHVLVDWEEVAIGVFF